MPSTLLRAPRRLATASLAAVVAAAGVSGCGSSAAGGADTDPAGLVPASAPLYAEAVVRPDDGQRANAEAVLRTVLRTNDPGGRLTALLDRRRGPGGLRFTRDVEPWLGNRVAVAVTGLRARRGADAVLVAASRDDARARDALARAVGGEQRSYRGVDYRVDPRRDLAAAVVGDAAVVGTEHGVKAAVDASKGASLAERDDLERARASVTDQRLGFLYLDVRRYLRDATAAAGGTAAQVAPLLDSVAAALPRTVAAALQADPDALRVDGAALGAPPGGPRPGPGGADALAALPADAWLGVGVGDLGGSLDKLLNAVASGGGLGALGVEALLAQARQRSGLDLRRDLLAWMGDAGVFATGAGARPRVGLVVHSTDPAATRRAIGRLAALVRRDGGSVAALRAAGVDAGFVVRDRGAGPGLAVAAAGDRFVVAGGRRALRDALRSGPGLGSRAALSAAASRLGTGVRPSFFLATSRLARRLARAHERAGGGARRARPVAAFGPIVAGVTPDGDTTRLRAVAVVR
jgi:Protein of unknown function (DUF3352)